MKKTMTFEEEKICREREAIQEWHKWKVEIPWLKFDNEWKVKIMPPFGGAIVRFYVSDGENDVSAYLDCYDILGYFGEPYWEIYPYDGDVYRVAMNDTETLIAGIRESLRAQGKGEGK